LDDDHTDILTNGYLHCPKSNKRYSVPISDDYPNHCKPIEDLNHYSSFDEL